MLREHLPSCQKGGRASLERGRVGDFSLTTKDLKAILKAMETDECVERGSEYRRAESKGLWEVRKGGKTDKEGTIECEPRVSCFYFLAL